MLPTQVTRLVFTTAIEAWVTRLATCRQLHVLYVAAYGAGLRRNAEHAAVSAATDARLALWRLVQSASRSRHVEYFSRSRRCPTSLSVSRWPDLLLACKADDQLMCDVLFFSSSSCVCARVYVSVCVRARACVHFVVFLSFTRTNIIVQSRHEWKVKKKRHQ